MNKVAKANKLAEIEWIRAISCLLVIIIHVTAEFWTSFIKGSVQYKFNIGLNTIAQFAVPGFIFLSGFVSYYVYHNKEYRTLDFYKKRMFKILIPYFVWSIIYIILNYNLYNYPIYLKTMAKDILIGRASFHLYYMVLIIQFYLVFPLLLKTYKKIDNKFISLAGFLAINIFVILFVKTPFKDRLFPNYLMFFGLGFFLAELKLKGFVASKALKVGIFSLYSIIALYYLMERYRVISELPLISNELYRFAWWYFSAISIIGIYLLANIIKAKRVNLIENKIVQSLSNHSFNIYLSHIFFITILRQLSWFNQFKAYSMTLAFVFELVIIIGISWLSSIALAKIKHLAYYNRLKGSYLGN